MSITVSCILFSVSAATLEEPAMELAHRVCMTLMFSSFPTFFLSNLRVMNEHLEINQWLFKNARWIPLLNMHISAATPSPHPHTDLATWPAKIPAMHLFQARFQPTATVTHRLATKSKRLYDEWIYSGLSSYRQLLLLHSISIFYHNVMSHFDLSDLFICIYCLYA